MRTFEVRGFNIVQPHLVGVGRIFVVIVRIRGVCDGHSLSRCKRGFRGRLSFGRGLLQDWLVLDGRLMWGDGEIVSRWHGR